MLVVDTFLIHVHKYRYFQSITKKLAEDPQLLHKVAERVHANTIQSSRSGPNTERKTGNNIFF